MRSCHRLLAVLIFAAVVGTVSPITAPGKVLADGPAVPGDSFVILLKGIYEPVVHGPHLGLSLVDLNDGTYIKTDIYRVSGLPGTTTEAIGTFYSNFEFTLCAYQLPGGTFAAVVTEFLYDFVEIDGQLYQVGTAELVIPEATGIYRPFVGGAIHMEFVTHIIDEVTWDEFCFCFINQ